VRRPGQAALLGDLGSRVMRGEPGPKRGSPASRGRRTAPYSLDGRGAVSGGRVRGGLHAAPAPGLFLLAREAHVGRSPPDDDSCRGAQSRGGD